MLPLSIGIFTYSTKPRGSVVHSANLADALFALGHDVTLYALDKDRTGFFRRQNAPVRLIPATSLPASAAGSEALISRRIGEVESFVAAHRPRHQIVHAEDCLMASGLLNARGDLGRALVCRTIHHVEHFESPYLEACQARSVREADLCMTVSEASQREVRFHYGRVPTLVTNGVSLDQFAPRASREDRIQARALLGIPGDGPVVLSVGGVEPRKNSLRMLEAMLSLRTRVPGLRWVLAGGASIFEHSAYRATFHELLRDAAAPTGSLVSELGVVPDDRMPLLYRAADVLLHASRHEGFGLCVLEAMASGIPVVVTRGAPFDEFTDDQTALKVDPTDPASIANAVQEALFGDGSTRVHASLERARGYSWERSARRHVAVYTDQLERDPRSEQAGSPASERRWF